MGVFDRLITRMRTKKLLAAGEEFAKFPKNPPTFDASALIKSLNEVRAKNSLPPLVSGLPLWKRYVGGEGPEFDAAEEGGIRPVVKANAYGLNDIKGDVDVLGQAILELRADVQALKEAPAPRPFP